jgi:hypothetical protein
MVEAVELVACHVFHLADRDDQCVSIGMVRIRLDRLRECPPGCCQLCAAATKVAPADVYRIAKAWQWRPPPPGCPHCADRDRSTKSCRDRIGRLSQHTGAVPFVRLRRAQLARLGASSANLGQTADYSQAIAHFADRRSRPLLCAKQIRPECSATRAAPQGFCGKSPNGSGFRQTVPGARRRTARRSARVDR